MAKNNKKYETPEVKVIVMETAPLLAGSGDDNSITGSGESGVIE